MKDVVQVLTNSCSTLWSMADGPSQHGTSEYFLRAECHNPALQHIAALAFSCAYLYRCNRLSGFILTMVACLQGLENDSSFCKFFQGFHFGIQADNLPGWATRIALQLSQSPAGRYRSSQSLVHMQFKLATWYDLQMMARNTHLSCGCCLMLLDVYRH